MINQPTSLVSLSSEPSHFSESFVHYKITLPESSSTKMDLLISGSSLFHPGCKPASYLSLSFWLLPVIRFIFREEFLYQEWFSSLAIKHFSQSGILHFPSLHSKRTYVIWIWLAISFHSLAKVGRFIRSMQKSKFLFVCF